MNDDDPSDVVARAVRRRGPGRPRAGPAHRRHPRHHPRGPARRRVGALPRALPARRRSSSRPPAASTTTCCAPRSARRSPRAAGRWTPARSRAAAGVPTDVAVQAGQGGIPADGRRADDPPAHRAGQRHHRRHLADRDGPEAVHALGPQRGARRRHVVAAVPGDPRAPRPGLLHVLVRVRPRRHRRLRPLRGLHAGQGRRGRRADGRRVGADGRRADHAGRARAVDGPAGRRAGARHGGLRVAHEPARQVRAGARRRC